MNPESWRRRVGGWDVHTPWLQRNVCKNVNKLESRPEDDLNPGGPIDLQIEYQHRRPHAVCSQFPCQQMFLATIVNFANTSESQSW